MKTSSVRREPMSSADSAWLHMDEPNSLMIVTGVLVLDRPVSLERTRAVVENRLFRFERFRQRVVVSDRPLTSARWEPDADFDLRRHLVPATLPAPGDETCLQRLVSDLMSEPLERAHPLWRIHVVERFQGGSALICRFHHCIGDGIAMVQVMMSMTEESGGEHQASESEAGGSGSAVGWAKNLVGDFLFHPVKALEAAEKISAATAALGKLALMPPDPASVFKGRAGKEKRAVWSRPIDLDRLKAVGRKTGTTINDVLLSAVSGALRRYLLRREPDAEVRDIRAVVPVNLRRPEEAHSLGNRFGLAFLQLPLGEREALERIFEVKARMTVIKKSPEALVSFQILKAIGVAPRRIYEHVLKTFGRKATAVMTNVKGPTSPVYFGGAPIREMMFWVPRSAGLGLGVSILSYNGRAWLGISADAVRIPDPETILEAFADEFDEMLELVRLVEGPA